MRALRYFFTDAAASLWRSRGPAALAILTIGAGLFVLGFFLIVNANLQQLVARLGESAEVSVFLRDDVTQAELTDIGALIDRSGLAAERTYVSKDQALARFRADFPDLAAAATPGGTNPLPASLELRLRSDLREAEGAIAGLVTAVGQMRGVADVRYDREWLTRVNALVRGATIAGALVVAMLVLAAAMTVANVVRLAAAARRDEIEIMQLVGAPFAYVRGPFVAEGILQGGLGAAAALLALGIAFVLFKARYGSAAAQALGSPTITFLAVPTILLMLFGGMLLGCVGGYVVARRVR